MRLVFIGSSGFGLKCLQACLEIPEVKVVGVVTAPKTFTISYRPQGVTNVLYADVSGLAKVNDIPVVTIERSMADPSMLETISTWKPDAFLVAGWYHMIPKQWRELAPAYGLHASLLPDYSGGAPLVWAMINGETKTGITCFQMDDGVDSGPIAGQREVKISPDDTIATLYTRIEQQGLKLLHEVLPAMAAGALNLRVQDESKRRVMPQRCPEDGRIDWNKDAEAIVRFIRAQTKPYPGAFCDYEGDKLIIWDAKLVYDDEVFCAVPGQVTKIGEGFIEVACGEGKLRLLGIEMNRQAIKPSELIRSIRKRLA